MRVVPLENEAVNECWIADRDRFSYEALNSPDRLRAPMIKQGGEWKEVNWQTALEYVANGLNQIKNECTRPANYTTIKRCPSVHCSDFSTRLQLGNKTLPATLGRYSTGWTR